MDSVISFVRRIIPPTETNFYVPSTWVLAGATVDLDFVNSRYWNDPNFVNATDLLSISRASTAYAKNAAGALTQFGNDTLRITDLGLLVEDSRTNVVLWNRDLTNVVWTPTNITAAKDQTGPDGVSNSASSLLATAGNGTILQSITLASSARAQSAYIKRITGTGTINMTMDNGSTWTAVTVTANWNQVSIPTQTLANPVVGFQIVTSGDAIAVDFVQNENGIFATSPIPTTTVAVARAGDTVQPISTLSSVLAGDPASFVANIRDLAPFFGSYHKYVDTNILIADLGGTRISNAVVGNYNVVIGNSLIMADGVKCGEAWDNSGTVLVAGGGTVQSVAGHQGYTGIYFAGNPSTAGTEESPYVYYRRITAWNTRIADTPLQILTEP